ncbi:NAD(P)/FAD-dependent oxidoreductase [Caldalkalibacillus mannanilyticus]|uniref:NAD(P)/FAD-dependent oxidoreductase n=1 Tax=Caldalkalibacillus mannanilyticus TaxID=1418 RepID=UPI0004697D85|nr:FAD-dependent oxidoreductase [Caldalkalibacillus mannanilyticus]
MDKHTDIIIIGGGIIGGAIAYYLSKVGFKVDVLERGELASGTSSKCDGNILAIDKEPGFDSQMSLASQKLVQSLSKELALPFEYRAPGSILVCETEEEMLAAEKWVKDQQAAGLPFRMLDQSDLRQESASFADDLLGGVECVSDSTVNPYLLTYSLFEAAKSYGAQVHTHTEVKNITRELNDFIVHTNNGRFRSQRVINAAGVWAPRIGEMLSIPIPIKPRKGHIIVAARQKQVGLRKVMEFGYLISKFGGKRKVDVETERYGVALVYEPTESQNFLIGSSRQFLGFETKVDMKVIRCMARRAVRFYPQMADMRFIRTYVGLRPYTEDHLPIISHVEEVPGFFVAAGHEGDGISLAAITGKLIEEMILGFKPSVPLEPLHYKRFKERMIR